MPVKLNVLKTKGWKTSNPEERGDIIVLEFIDEQTHRLLFTYAPKWEDMDMIIDCLEMVFNNELNKLHCKSHGLRTFEKEYTERVINNGIKRRTNQSESKNSKDSS